MFFLLRMAFWLGLVFVLLPTDKSQDASKGPQVGAADAIVAASAAVSDMAQFCTRQPTACEVGEKAASVVGARVQNGARKAYQFITEKSEKSDKPDTADVKPEIEKAVALPAPAPKKTDKRSAADKKNPDHTGSIDGTPDEDTPSDGLSHDTLTADDLQADWQPASPPL